MPAQTISDIKRIRPDSGSTVSTRMLRASSSRFALLRATCTSIVCGGWSSPKARYIAATRTRCPGAPGGGEGGSITPS